MLVLQQQRQGYNGEMAKKIYPAIAANFANLVIEKRFFSK